MVARLHKPDNFLHLDMLARIPVYASVAGSAKLAVRLEVPSLLAGWLSVPQDARLGELRRQMDANGGEAPFMIGNEAILKAVPKKKPSYRRTRQKLYAPGDKQVQHLDNLVRCPACGHFKRSHFMCMHCFAEIRDFLKLRRKEEHPQQQNSYPELDEVDEKILYPGKRKNDHQRRLEKKEWIPQREQPLMYQRTDKLHGK